MSQRTMTKPNVRPAGPEDRAAIREVTLAAYAQYAGALGELWPIYLRDISSAVEHPEPALQLVAEKEGRILGAGMLYPAGTTFAWKGKSLTTPYPELRLLAVAPEHRGQGVALAVMKEGVARARASGAPAVMFHTTQMMRAERLYARAGSFVRRPELDISVTPDVTIEAYVMTFAGDGPAL